MRMMMRCTCDVDAGNHAIKEGKMGEVVQKTIEALKPEAAYFTADHGNRTGFFIFDMKDSAQMPPIAEPWFMQLKAKVEFIPVMNGDDLKKGLGEVAKQK